MEADDFYYIDRSFNSEIGRTLTLVMTDLIRLFREC